MGSEHRSGFVAVTGRPNVGKMMREIGKLGRESIEQMSGRKVYLDLRVKVWPGWRDDAKALRQLGYG